MVCVNRVMCGSFLLAFSLALPAQQPVPSQPQQPDSTQQSDTVYTMDQVPPPPANASAHDLEVKGDVLRAEKAFLDAVDYYRAAMKKSDTAVLHNKAGICFLLIRRDHDAKKEFERSIKLDRTYPEAYNNLGALLYNGRKFGPAIKEYKKAIQLSEHNASFHSNLGTAYFSEKDFQNATREYALAMQIDPAIFDHQPSGGVSVKLVSSNDLGHYHYVMAQMFGMHKDEERCRYYLAKANEEGYPVLMALHDNQFAELRKDPEFVTYVRSLKRPPQESSDKQ